VNLLGWRWQGLSSASGFLMLPVRSTHPASRSGSALEVGQATEGVAGVDKAQAVEGQAAR